MGAPLSSRWSAFASEEIYPCLECTMASGLKELILSLQPKSRLSLSPSLMWILYLKPHWVRPQLCFLLQEVFHGLDSWVSNLIIRSSLNLVLNCSYQIWRLASSWSSSLTYTMMLIFFVLSISCLVSSWSV